ncbi:hypothetical protein CUS73_06720 [Enterococcus faecalis]|nr:hypothetical protein [Enterococcus faecalis]EGO2722685.1 hypothetical protein [Enterococcus faecalis]EGO5970202.1 hypothetical protein [Enterococcus faecalis]EHU9671266.1 hypothetical protein [Enterococcus faecalis]EHV0131159.1 hypothetical protein [Enterococcus faecalis]EHV0134434.1 hypothetical protein [Enterococcus faecalis]
MKKMNKLSKINDLAFDLMHEAMEPSKQFSYGKQIYDLSDEPELNENQHVVLDWLKESCKLNGLREVIEIMGFLSTTGGKMKYKQVAYAYGDLNDDELAQVLQAFIRWALEEEAE